MKVFSETARVGFFGATLSRFFSEALVLFQQDVQLVFLVLICISLLYNIHVLDMYTHKYLCLEQL